MTKDKAELAVAGVVGVLAVPFLLGIALYVIFAHGYIASCIWAWYAVPLGLPALGWKTWAGVMCLKAVLRRGAVSDPDKKVPWSVTAAHIAAPWLTLLVAWVLR